MPLNSFTKNLSIVRLPLDEVLLLVVCNRLERVMLFKLFGCGCISSAMGGICSDLRSKSAWKDFLVSL